MSTMSSADVYPGIRWRRVIAGGVLIELGLMVVSVIAIAMGREDDLPRIILPTTVVIALLAGLWVGRRTARALVNAALAGAVAIPLYVVIVLVAWSTQPEVADTGSTLSAAYLATHVIKVLGAATGGWLAARTRSSG